MGARATDAGAQLTPAARAPVGQKSRFAKGGKRERPLRWSEIPFCEGWETERDRFARRCGSRELGFCRQAARETPNIRFPTFAKRLF